MWITAPNTSSCVNQKCLLTSLSVPWRAKPPAAGNRWWSLLEAQHAGTRGVISGGWRSPRFAQTRLPVPAWPWRRWPAFSRILLWASVETERALSGRPGGEVAGCWIRLQSAAVLCLRLPALHRSTAWSPWGGCSWLFCFKKLPFFSPSFFQPWVFQPLPSLALHLGLPLMDAISEEQGSRHTS